MNGPTSAVGGASSRGRWTRAAGQVLLDLSLGVGFVALLALTRVVLFVFFRARMSPESGPSDVALMVLRGLRFDLRTAIGLVAPLLLLSALCAAFDLTRGLARLRRWYAALFTGVTVIVLMFDVGYFQEYDDQFNAYALGILTDDLVAIAKTIWHGYPMHLLLPLMGGLAAVAGWAAARVLRRDTSPLERRLAALKTGPRVVLPFALAGLLTVGFIGKLDRALVRRDAWVGADVFLNKIVLNPYQRLYYAVKEHVQVVRGNAVDRFIRDGDVTAAAMRHFALSTPPRDLDAAARQVAPGSESGTKPHTIFFVMMESYSSWTLSEKYRVLGLSEGLRAVAEKGLYLPRVLSSGHLTIWTLNYLLTGLPDAGMAVNYHPATRTPFPTSLAPQFSRLGYRTRFLTGSLLSWQWIGEYAKNQGFEEVVGGASMGAKVVTDWGVPDKELFEYAQAHLDCSAPSFNFVLTTSNHAPFDVKDTGSPLTALPPQLAQEALEPVDFPALGHHWYADRHLKTFVDVMERRCPGSLFVITGDHTARVYAATHPTVEETLAVPLVLYGPSVLGELRFPPTPAASHHDLLPTVMHLAAPKGFEFYSWGRDLFVPAPDAVALGRNAALTPTAAVDFGIPPGGKSKPRVQGPLTGDEVDQLQRRVEDLYGLSVYRVRRGAALPPLKAEAPAGLAGATP